MPLKVAHLFVQYPHRYQPYNVRLVERQAEAGIICYTFSFSVPDPDHHSGDLSLTIFNKLKFILNALFVWPRWREFAKVSKTSFLNSLLLVGRFSEIASKKPDILHVHHLQLANEHTLELIRVFGLRWVISIRGYETSVRPLLSRVDFKFVSRCFEHAHGIHAVCEDLRKKAIGLGADESKIMVIRRTAEEITLVTRNVSYDEPEIIVTTIGRFNWVKGLVYALQAVKILVDKNVNVVLHVSGNGNETEESEMRFWINLLKLADRVVLHGFLDSESIDRLLQKTHVYLQPSINEGIPNTLVRIAGNKIPVVASRVGGIPEIIEDNVHGLLVNPGNPQEIAEAVQRILENKPLRDTIQKAHLMNVSFDPKHEIGLYKELYRRITNTSHKV